MSSDWPELHEQRGAMEGSGVRESHGQSWVLEVSEGQVETMFPHPSPPLASTHIRSGQILFLSLLLPAAPQATCSLVFHHTLRG